MLEQLEKEEANLRMLLCKNQGAQLEINKKAFIEKWGFRFGDEVKYESNAEIIFAIICGINCSATKPENYYVNPQSKNGKTYQQRILRISEWNLKTMKKI